MDNLPKSVKLLLDDDSKSQIEKGIKINKKYLINLLNYINFQNGTIFINLKHSKYNNTISLSAKPQPCLDGSLYCLWVGATGLNQKLKSYEFLHLLLADNQKLILVKPDLKRMSEEGISFNLPETCCDINSRKVRRHSCEGIQVEFIQNGIVFYGSLLDFSPISFRVEVSTMPPQSFQWVNPESTIIIIFKNEQDILYSGECKITRQNDGQRTRKFALKPLSNQIQRFKPKEFRSLRQKLSPSPNSIFRHPLTKKMLNLGVEDLSGSGFSVKEYDDNSVLLPGMVIPKLEIEFARDFNIVCKAQVAYRNIYKTKDDEPCVKCGIAFLDIDIQDQVRLSSLLHNTKNKRSNVCNRVDLDDLWKFFFDVGFVYPKKYASMHAFKEKIKGTFESLYIRNPNIARHFIYQDKGTIQGHISMVRFYENTWLFHHHASSRASFRAGVEVLNQIERYVNDFHSLYSTRMNFVACYFRPDNRFPNRVFGGCAIQIDDLKACSLDSFANFQFPKTSAPWGSLGAGSLLAKTQTEDLLELGSFYRYISGGLMLNALDLEPDMIYSDNLNKEYQEIGFKRERHLFTLKKDGDIKAIIMVNVSDIGLNLSNLTNCIHVFVLDSNDVPCETLYSVLSMLSKYYVQDKISVLLYPVSYAESQSVPYEKIYKLWVMNMQYLDYYFKYMGNLFNRTHHE